MSLVDQQASAELALISACATNLPAREAIRSCLSTSIDWNAFAREIVNRRIANVVGHVLLSAAPDLLPADIRDAFVQLVTQVWAANDSLLARVGSESTGHHRSLEVEAELTRVAAALSEDPNDARPWGSLGHTLAANGRLRDSLLCFDRAAALDESSAISWRDCAWIRLRHARYDEALVCIDKALAIAPGDGRAWTIKAEVLSMLRRFPEAREASAHASAIDATNSKAARIGTHARLLVCDWRNRSEMLTRIKEGIRAGRPVVTPFNHLAVSDSESENLAVARIWARGVPAKSPLWRNEVYHHDRIHIAYVSTDFLDTLSVNAIASGFSAHDKSRFRLTGVSLSDHDGSDTRKKIEASFDTFIDGQRSSDEHIARMLRDAEVDIALDLNGFAGNKRTGIFAYRPAPVQVNFLGYAGTMAMPFYDYIIADRIVIPEENRSYYSEQVVYMPDTYFPTDRERQISSHIPTRSEAGLPAKGFVFTCQNTPYKITPEIFGVWMRLLRELPDSVLWLSSTIPAAISALRAEAEACGVLGERVIFCPRVEQRSDHLARLKLADLFLDTIPYNAHTTCSDALWAGLPLVTCTGQTFPSRVAASLLSAVGMQELVASSLNEYFNLALDLACNAKKLEEVKVRLSRNRDREPLFDTLRYTRNLESALFEMWQRTQRGEGARGFSVK